VDVSRKHEINGTQRLKFQPHLKWTMVMQAMEGSQIVVLNIGETLIPCIWIFVVLHAQDMHDHFVDDLCLAINLGVEGGGFGELGVQ
jgi:hypothetical protein